MNVMTQMLRKSTTKLEILHRQRKQLKLTHKSKILENVQSKFMRFCLELNLTSTLYTEELEFKGIILGKKV